MILVEEMDSHSVTTLEVISEEDQGSTSEMTSETILAEETDSHSETTSGTILLEVQDIPLVTTSEVDVYLTADTTEEVITMEVETDFLAQLKRTK